MAISTNEKVRVLWKCQYYIIIDYWNALLRRRGEVTSGDDVMWNDFPVGRLSFIIIDQKMNPPIFWYKKITTCLFGFLVRFQLIKPFKSYLL